VNINKRPNVLNLPNTQKSLPRKRKDISEEEEMTGGVERVHRLKKSGTWEGGQISIVLISIKTTKGGGALSRGGEGDVSAMFPLEPTAARLKKGLY